MRIVQDRQSADRVWQEQQHQQIQYEKTMHYSSDSIRGTNVDVTV